MEQVLENILQEKKGERWWCESQVWCCDKTIEKTEKEEKRTYYTFIYLFSTTIPTRNYGVICIIWHFTEKHKVEIVLVLLL